MKGTTSVPMCSIFVHRCVPLVLFSLFWAFDVFPFFLLCNYLFLCSSPCLACRFVSFSCHHSKLSFFLFNDLPAYQLKCRQSLNSFMNRLSRRRSFRFWLLRIFLPTFSLISLSPQHFPPMRHGMRMRRPHHPACDALMLPQAYAFLVIGQIYRCGLFMVYI
jgi:hypothetical protein